MKIVCGDILAINHGVIVHQVNCKKVMGAGLALQIRRKYPQHFADYMAAEPKLGDIVVTRIHSMLYIVGVYGQYSYGRYGLHTNYSALRIAMIKATHFAAQKNLQMFIPYGIGCGLAGGNWNQVMKILSSVNKNSIVVRKAKDEEDAVAFWHEHETGNTLMEYMQMTEAEYEAFIKNDTVD
jgi:O-acetyl-ADP-ribose deacetylase (regulator of RNase III)